MNRIRIYITNFGNELIESFSRTKIIIEDFPRVLGIRFLTHVWSISEVHIQALTRMFFIAQTFTISNNKVRSLMRAVILSTVEATSNFEVRASQKMVYLTKIYSASKVRGHLYYRFPFLTRSFFLTKVAFKSDVFNKISEVRNDLIQDIRDMTIDEFIKRELIT